ncbi:hypothetical protein [Bacillus sp. CDB3]|uniref:hypothetical protein n=1 Tax=Bacillus sp. CDB3 TaxID=360310 RepID=UPI0009D8801A|nr:hypothetical protein [Bacillus sp. CDB3]OQR53389.1 hypothetical protein CDB3_30190 [Bacillus sp. CDB3]
MKRSNRKLNMKKGTVIALASAISFSSLGVLGVSVHAVENTNNVTIKAEDMSIKQLRNAIQQKNDPFINQVKIFIDKHFQESEFLWGKVSKKLKINIVDLLVGNEEEYSKKVDAIRKNHLKEATALLLFASPEFVKDLIKLLDYLPK